MGVHDNGIAIYRRPWPFFASPGWDEITPFICIHCLQLGRYLYLSLELDTNRRRIPQQRSFGTHGISVVLLPIRKITPGPDVLFEPGSKDHSILIHDPERSSTPLEPFIDPSVPEPPRQQLSHPSSNPSQS